MSFEEYQEKVRDVYDGPQGAMLAACSMFSLHTPLGERLFRERKFDLRGARQILDVGSGAGQIAQAPAEVRRSGKPADLLRFVAGDAPPGEEPAEKPAAAISWSADLTRLPFPDGAFDCVTCGYVLEHLPDAKLGLAEFSRVMIPGAGCCS